MTSVKQNNDTALRATRSHTVIGEGLIQSLPSQNRQIKCSEGPESKSADDTVRSAQREILLEQSEQRKKEPGPRYLCFLNKGITARRSCRIRWQSPLASKHLQPLKTQENAEPKLSKRNENAHCWVMVHISQQSGSSVEFIHFKG